MSNLRERLEALKTDTRDWLKNWAENGLPECNEWAFKLVGCCPNGCPTTPQKERRGVTEKETLVSIVFNHTCGEVEERWQICCVLCGYQGPKAPTKQLAVIEHLAKENNLLRAILADSSEAPPTLAELRESGEWFLARQKADHTPNEYFPPMLIYCAENGALVNQNRYIVTLLPGDIFKRICDTEWTTVEGKG